MKPKTVAVMFGGRSAEHEISVITALQAISAIDTLCYEVIPVYIHTSGKWYSGKKLLDKSFYRNLALSEVQQVTLLPDPTIGGLIPISAKGSMHLEDHPDRRLFFGFSWTIWRRWMCARTFRNGRCRLYRMQRHCLVNSHEQISYQSFLGKAGHPRFILSPYFAQSRNFQLR